MQRKLWITLLIVLMLMIALVGVVYAEEGENNDLDTPEETEGEDLNELSPVCSGDRPHPVLVRLAERYKADYDMLAMYFCDYEMGVGQISLALSTSLKMEGEVSMEELLLQRIDEGLGWGQIWQSLGLIGNNQQNGENDYENGNGTFTPPGLSGQFGPGNSQGHPLGGPPGQNGNPNGNGQGNPGKGRGQGN